MRKGLFSPCYKQKHWGSEWSTELVSHRPTAAVSWGGTDNTGPHTTAAAPAARTLLSRMLCSLNTPSDDRSPPPQTRAPRPREATQSAWGARQGTAVLGPTWFTTPGTLSWPVKGGQLLFICGKSRCLQQKTVLFLLFQFVWLFFFLPHRSG